MLAATFGDTAYDVLATARPFRVVAAVDLLLLCSVVVVMVVKPT